VAVLVVAAAVIAAAACPAPASALEGSDWQHALRVAQQLRADPPQVPVVLLLGGSCAREATVGDASWAADVADRGGPKVVAYNLGSRNQTFEQETALIDALPRVPMLVFIGVNRGRFTSPPTTTTSTTPEATKGTYTQHHYSSTRVWSTAKKRSRIQYWLRQRYPVFRERYAANVERLDELVAACLRRGYHPVIVDLPRNTAVIGDAFDEALDQYQRGCREVAGRHGVPFLAFIDGIGLEDRDFYDLDHLVEPGRPKFQGRLSEETVRLLASYDLAAGAEAPGGLSGVPGGRALRVLLPFLAVAVLALAVQRRRAVLRRRRRARRRQATAERS
jgi:hypothetical protein